MKMSNAEYHAHPAVSNSRLGRLDRCPAAYLVEQDQTTAMLFGSAFHSYALEGETQFLAEFAIAPQCDKRTKEGKATFEAFAAGSAGKSVISADDFSLIKNMTEAIYQHPYANVMLTQPNLTEESFFWTDTTTNIECKCRPDRMLTDARIVIDLKTTTDASERGFTQSCNKFGYARQAGFYLDGIRANGHEYDAFCFIAVEKEAPHRVEVYMMDQEFIEWGRMEYLRLLNILDNCTHARQFPNFQNDGISTLFKPAYL